MQQGDLSQNKVSKTSVTQICLWLLKKQFRSTEGGAGGVCFCAATGYVEKHRAVTHSVHTLCFSILCVFVFWETKKCTLLVTL